MNKVLCYVMLCYIILLVSKLWVLIRDVADRPQLCIFKCTFKISTPLVFEQLKIASGILSLQCSPALIMSIVNVIL